MPLSGNKILKKVKQTVIQKIRGKQPDIVIFPYDKFYVGSDHYVVHLADTMYENTSATLKPGKQNSVCPINLKNNGGSFWPISIYHAESIEFIETQHIPEFIIHPTLGRLGVQMNAEIPFVDGKYSGNVKMTLTSPNKVQIRIHPGTPIAIVRFSKNKTTGQKSSEDELNQFRTVQHTREDWLQTVKLK